MRILDSQVAELFESLDAFARFAPAIERNAARHCTVEMPYRQFPVRYAADPGNGVFCVTLISHAERRAGAILTTTTGIGTRNGGYLKGWASTVCLVALICGAQCAGAGEQPNVNVNARPTIAPATSRDNTKELSRARQSLHRIVDSIYASLGELRKPLSWFSLGSGKTARPVAAMNGAEPFSHRPMLNAQIDREPKYRVTEGWPSYAYIGRSDLHAVAASINRKLAAMSDAVTPIDTSLPTSTTQLQVRMQNGLMLLWDVDRTNVQSNGQDLGVGVGFRVNFR